MKKVKLPLIRLARALKNNHPKKKLRLLTGKRMPMTRKKRQKLRKARQKKEVPLRLRPKRRERTRRSAKRRALRGQLLSILGSR